LGQPGSGKIPYNEWALEYHGIKFEAIGIWMPFCSAGFAWAKMNRFQEIIVYRQ